MSPDDATAILKAISGHRIEGVITLMLATGLRSGEALGLRWTSIDLEGPSLTVDKALQRIEREWVLVEPKSARSRRTVLLLGVAVAALWRHRARQKSEREAAGDDWHNPLKLVFTTPKGMPIDGRNLLRTFRLLLEQAGLPRWPLHDLRHACASLLIAKGASPRTVMEVLGHSQISLTMDTYAHIIPELKREAADLIDDALAADGAGKDG